MFAERLSKLGVELKEEKEAKETQRIYYTNELNPLKKQLAERFKEINTLTKEKISFSNEALRRGLKIVKKDKTINSLQLKNEKLTESYKKLINHLADARQLVVHLQTDLSATQQDKTHIQQELNDALAILNKPTQEMGTQTDLTAEEITQMEKDLSQLREQVGKEHEIINNLNQQLTNLQTEQTQKEQTITDLQAKVKDLIPNEQEKVLLGYCDTTK